MNSVTPQDLARNPGALLDRIEAGERLVIVRDGRPVAELRPVAPAHAAPRPFGLAAGAFAVPDDFAAPLPDEVLREFEGRRGSRSTPMCSCGTSPPTRNSRRRSARPSRTR